MKINELLKEYRADFGGTLPQNTLPGLYDLIKYVQNNLGKEITVIEIGAFEGVSTELFAITCKQVYTVDGWDLSVTQNNYNGIPIERLKEAELRCRSRLKDYDNVTIMKKISEKAHFDFVDNSYDLVYIDGDHIEEAVYNDIIWWKSKIKEGGYIAGHDYSNIYTVKRAVDNIFGKPDIVFGDCSWLKKI